MKFKELRDKIFCGCKILIGNTQSEYISTHEPSEYDECEVMGIRSRDIKINGFAAGSYIEVLLKEEK